MAQNSKRRHNTVRLTKTGEVHINNGYAGCFEKNLSGWLCAHFITPWESFYRKVKADTRSGLREIISETINSSEK